MGGSISVVHPHDESKKETDVIVKFATDVDSYITSVLLENPDDIFLSILIDAKTKFEFREFLKSEFSEENFLFFEGIEDIKTSTASFEEILLMAKEVYRKFLTPGCDMEVNLSSTIRKSVEMYVGGVGGGEDRTSLINVFEAAQKDIIKVIALGSVPRFLQCARYKELRAKFMSNIQNKIKIENIYDMYGAQIRERMLSNLHVFTSAIENIPLCVSVAAKQSDGFPLIYVNNCYEKTTGYSKRELLGENCNFLQISNDASPTTSAEAEAAVSLSTSSSFESAYASSEESCSIELELKMSDLSRCLSEAKASKLELTSFRKNGTSYRNQISMKPVFSEKGEYLYVISIAFDLTLCHGLLRAQLVDQIMKIIPDKVSSSI